MSKFMKSNFGKNKKWKRVVAGALAALMLVTSSGTDWGTLRVYANEELSQDIEEETTGIDESDITVDEELAVTPTASVVNDEAAVTPTSTVTPEVEVTPEAGAEPTSAVPSVVPDAAAENESEVFPSPSVVVTPEVTPAKTMMKMGALRQAPIPDLTLTISDVDTNYSAESYGEERTIYYGDKVTFAVAGIDAGNVTFKYLDTSKNILGTWSTVEFYDGYCLIEPGEYYLGYASTTSANSFTDSYKLTVLPADIGKPVQMAFKRNEYKSDDTSFALNCEYSKPVSTARGGYLGDVLSSTIEISLYKEDSDGNYKSLEGTRTSISESSSYSIAPSVRGGGYGTYKFSLKYSLKDDAKKFYNDGTEVLSEETFEYKDEINPTIVEYKYISANNKLSAVISDIGSGLDRYAFSTESDASNVIDWNNLSDSKSQTVLSDAISEGGKYYLHVKDKSGLITTSDKRIDVTVVKYSGLYNGITEITDESKCTDILVCEHGSGGCDCVIELKSNARTGHKFSGWSISDADPLAAGTKITRTSEFWAKTVNAVARWDMKEIEVTLSVTDGKEACLTGGYAYDAVGLDLIATVTGIEDAEGVSYEYKWNYSKNGTEWNEIAGANSKTYRVKNVDQSGYYKVSVKAIVGSSEGSPVEKAFENKITITPKDLSISLKNNVKIGYGDELPLGSHDLFIFDGLCDDDEVSITHSGDAYLKSNKYASGNNAGTYDIEPCGFESNNYKITQKNEDKLIVEPKSVKGFTAVLDNDTHVYDGNPFKPNVVRILDENNNEVTLVGGTEDISSNDYIISYSETKNAGTHTVELNFDGTYLKKNYTGKITAEYTITKSDYNVEVRIADWVYGDYKTELGPVVVGKISGTEEPVSIDNSKVHFEYKKAGDSDENATSERPENAGNYVVRAQIDALSNYSEKTTEWKPFEISKRTLVLESKSEEFTYDGNQHSIENVEPYVGEYTDSNGNKFTHRGLKFNDAYSVSPHATTIVREVTEGTPNEISYTFTDATNANNYEVILVEGTLKVNPQELIYPTKYDWSSLNPGVATWIGVSKKDLGVSYQIQLFKNGELIKNGENDCFTTTENSYNFSDVIRKNCTKDNLGTFTFKIKTIPYDGDAKDNYKAKEAFSAPSSELHTGWVEVGKSEGIENATVAGVSNHVIIQGETLAVSATYQTGYEAAEVAWTSDIAELIISDVSKADTDIKFTAADNKVYTVIAHAKDTPAVIEWKFDDYNAGYESDKTKVQLNVVMSDDRGVQKYRVVKLDNASSMSDDDVKNTYSNIEEDQSAWIDVNKTSENITYTITEEGRYYFCAYDGKNYVWTDPCKVYSVSFDKADANATGEMSKILKVNDYDIKALPENGFSKAGYAFTEWKLQDSNKVYVNKGMFAENDKSIVLEAKWSNKKLSYDMVYFCQNIDDDGYTQVGSETFAAIINDHQKYSQSDSYREFTGFTLSEIQLDGKTISAGDPGEIDADITISDEGHIYKAYYARNSYKINYSYTDIDGTPGKNSDNETIIYSESYKYGQSINAVPEDVYSIMGASIKEGYYYKNGYRFTDWSYDGAANRPATMPATDIKVTGRFMAPETSYVVHYYVKPAGSDAYSELEDEKQIINAKHGDNVVFAATKEDAGDAINPVLAKDIAGYDLVGIVIKNGSAVGDLEPASKCETGVVSAESDKTLNVYFIYTPHEYNITLNVWLGGEHTEENRIYSATWKCMYGQALFDSEKNINIRDEISTYYEKVVVGGNQSSILAPDSSSTGVTVPAGYIISNDIRWSTDDAPSSMPNGDITVSREYKPKEDVEYLVEVYFQKEDGVNYDKVTTLSYAAPEGATVTIKSGTKPANDNINIYIEDLKKLVGGSSYYDFAVAKGDLDDEVVASVAEDGTITSQTKIVPAQKDELKFKMYFDRKKYDITVEYHAVYGDKDILIKKESPSVQTEGRNVNNPDLIGVWNKPVTTVVTNEDNSRTVTGFDPLKYFNNSSVKVDSGLNDTDGAGKTYFAAEYHVYYIYDSSILGDPFWNRYTFDSVASLKDWYKDTYKKNKFATGEKRTIYVYYCKPPKIDENLPEFSVDVKINPNPINSNPTYNCTYLGVLNGQTNKTYNYKIVSKSVVYETKTKTFFEPDYPGLVRLMKPKIDDYVEYTGNIKAGYTDVSAFLQDYKPEGYIEEYNDDYEYFIKDGGSDNTIYIVMPDERFRPSMYYSVSLHKTDGSGKLTSTSAPYREAVALKDTYNKANESGLVVFSNTGTNGMYIVESKDGNPTIKNISGNGILTYSYKYKEYKEIVHRINGNDCAHDNDAHRVAVGDSAAFTKLSIANCAALNSKKDEKSGYELKIFADSEFEHEITGATYDISKPEFKKYSNIQDNQVVYAEYFKKAIDYTKEIHYELADNIGNINYITSSMINVDGSLKEHGDIKLDKVTTTLESYDIKYTQGGKEIKKTVTPSVDTYSYDGNVVLIVEHHKEFAFSDIVIDKSHYGSTNELVFDGANSSNKLKAYLEANSVALHAYYSRENYSLKLDKGDSADSADYAEKTKYKAGQTIKLETPVRNGYMFAGWIDTEGNSLDESLSIEYYDSNNNKITITDNDYSKAAYAVFKMPLKEVSVKANWKEGDIEIEYFYYFQKGDKNYDEERLAQALSGSAVKVESVKVVFDEEETEGFTKYTVDEKIICVSKDDRYYMVKDDGSVDSTGLFAVHKNVIAKTKDNLNYVTDLGALSEFYAYSSAVCNNEYTHISTTAESADDIFIAEFGQTVKAYFARSKKVEIKLEVEATDGGANADAATVSLSIDKDNIFYGDTVTVSVAPAAGYTFEGWYEKKGSDISAEKYSANKSFTVIAKSDKTFVAKVTPIALDMVLDDGSNDSGKVSIDISTEGGKSLEYDYGYSSGKNIHAAVHIPDTADKAIYVSKYIWYKVDEVGGGISDDKMIQESTDSDYKFPTGMNAGTYYYRCEVEFARADNGRTQRLLCSQTVKITVNPVPIKVDVTSWKGVYDGDNHQITVELADDEYLNEIRNSLKISYYEGEDESKASTTNINKRDVNTTADGIYDATPYVIKYKVELADNVAESIRKNYEVATGEGTIEIIPKTVSVEKTSNPYYKTFDNDEKVLGTLSDDSSDKYRLSYGESGKAYYSLIGIVSGDNVTLDFDAEFNNKHVHDAGSVTLTNLKVVNNDEMHTANANYRFVDGDEITLSAYIEQKLIPIIWKDMPESGVYSYVYNGLSHCPEVVVDESITLPDGLNLVAKNAKINANKTAQDKYTATAALVVEGDNSDIDVKDYRIVLKNDIGNQDTSAKYRIEKYPLTIKACDGEETYNKQAKSINKFKIKIGDQDYKELVNESVFDETYGFKFKVDVLYKNEKSEAVKPVINAGIYTVLPQNAIITNNSNENVADNFTIIYENGILKVDKKVVTVSGITVAPKIYDGTNVATVVRANPLIFSVVEEGDALELDPSNDAVTAVFNEVGVGKQSATITIKNDALWDVDTHATSVNYTLKADGTDYEQNITAPDSENITKKEAKVKLKSETFEATYGNELVLSVVPATENDFVETTSSIGVSGTIKFTIKQGAKTVKEIDYVIPENSNVSDLEAISIAFGEHGLNAGTYTVEMSVGDGLNAELYTIGAASEAGEIKVNPKEIELVAKESSDITKIYDANTNVVDADVTKILKNDSGNYFTVNGLVGSDSVIFTKGDGFTAQYNDKNAGDRTITLKGIKVENDNYKLKSTELAIPATITARQINLTVNNISATYGDSKSDILSTDNDKYSKSVIADGLQGSDSLDDSVTYSYTTNYDSYISDSRKVGEYNLSVEVLEKSGNYSIGTIAAGKLTINPKQVNVSITTSEAGKTYYKQGDKGKNPSSPEYYDRFEFMYGQSANYTWFKPVFDGLVYDDEVANDDCKLINYTITTTDGAVTYTNSAPEQMPTIAGNFTINPDLTGLSKYSNYTFVSNSETTLSVTKAPLNLSNLVLGIIDKTYNGNNKVDNDGYSFGTNYSGKQIKATAAGGFIVESGTVLDYSYWNKSGILERDIDWLRQNKSTGLVFDTDKTVFASKDVVYNEDRIIQDQTVTLDYKLCQYLDGRYSISDGRVSTATAKILPKDLQITAKVLAGEGIALGDNITVKYGNAVPEFANEYTSFVEGENTSVLEAIAEDESVYSSKKYNETTKERWGTDYTETVESHQYSHVSESVYTVTPYGFTQDSKGNNNNYHITYVPCTFKVIQSVLDAPKVAWVEGKPGTVKFEKVDGIGDVKVEKYVVVLTKAGNDIDSYDAKKEYVATEKFTSQEVDFLEVIRANGPGTYNVEVTAYAKTENNASYINVAQKGIPGKCIDDIYAANLTISPTDDVVTSKAVEKSKLSADNQKIKVSLQENTNADDNTVTKALSGTEDALTVVVVQGETISTTIATGDHSTANNIWSGYTVPTPTVDAGKAEVAMNGTANWDYTYDITVKTLKNSDTINVGLSFAKNETQIESVNLVVNQSEGLAQEVEYGYKDSDLKKLKLTVNLPANDNVGIAGYNYTYTWKVIELGEGEADPATYLENPVVTKAGNVDQPNVCEQIIKTGVSKGTYYIYCEVKATRIDNGHDADYNTMQKLGNNGMFVFDVKPGTLVATVGFADSNSTWTYGDARKVPALTFAANYAECMSANDEKIKYYYSENPDLGGTWNDSSIPSSWSEKMITDAGTWYVRAYIPTQTNYSSYVTDAVAYTINPVKLGAVSEIILATDKDNYGKVSWTAPDTIYENNNTEGKTDSNVVPHYNVSIGYRESDTGDFVEKAKFDNLSDATCNIEEYLTAKGQYQVTVTAIPDADNTKDSQNAEASEVRSAIFKVGDTSANEEIYSKVYDGNPLTLTADFGGLEITEYNWYVRQGTTTSKVSNATSNMIGVTNVSESGKYFCVGTATDGEHITVIKQVTITKADDTIRDISDIGKVYDGKPVAYPSYSHDDKNKGETVSYVYYKKNDSAYEKLSSTPTDAGDYAVEVKISGDNNYNDATSAKKDFTISKKPVTITAKSETKTYDGIALTYVGKSVAEAIAADKTTSLCEGHTLVGITLAGTITKAGTTTNMPSAAVINATGSTTNLASNYDITYVAGELKVEQKVLSIKSKDSTGNVYKGDEYIKHEFDYVDNTALASGDTISVEYSGTQTYVGSSDNTISKVTIQNSSNEDVTDSYRISTSSGTISVVAKPITVKAKDASKVYDGTALVAVSGVDGVELADGTTLGSGDVIAAAEVTGSQTDKGESASTITGNSVKLTKNGEDVTTNYAITLKTGKLTVTAKAATISVKSAKTSKDYNQTAFALTRDDVDVNTTEGNVEFEYYATNSAGSKLTEAPVNAGTYYVKAKISGCSNYSDAETDFVQITINPIDDEIVVDANYNGKVYDGTNMSNPSYTHNNDNKGTNVTYVYYKKNSASYEKLTFVPTDAGDYAVEVKISGDSNYKVSTSAKKDFTISKKPIIITAKSDEKVYDGTAFTYVGKSVADGILSKGELCTGHDLTSITYSGSVTTVGEGEVDNDISNAFICTSTDTNTNLAPNYDITYVPGKLKITPHDIDILELNGKTTDSDDNIATVIFNGAEVGPSIAVKANGINNAVKTLVKDTDYTVLVSDTSKPSAVYPDIYTVEVEGIGNYKGKLSLKYKIEDTVEPVISGGTTEKDITPDDPSKNIYCVTSPTLKVSDPTLKTIEIKSGATTSKTYTLNPETATKVDGNVVWEIPASDLPATADGAAYTITATDMSGNVTSVEVTVYSDHAFTRDKYEVAADKQTHSAPCDHDCGYVDTKAIKHVTVKWEYDYKYNSIDGWHTGIQGESARATGARVELLQDGVVVATTYLDCDDECGVTGGQTSATKSFTFVEDDVNGLLPINKEDGTPYVYTISVTATNNGTNHNDTHKDEYDAKYTLDQTLTGIEGSPKGTFAELQYAPDTFYMPWIVTLDSPTPNGNPVMPDKIYVKVVFAHAGDELDESKYEIISQQANQPEGDRKGEECVLYSYENGKAVYEGQYPVWKGTANSGETYYHRIEITGYEYDGVYYDTEGQNYRSICDDDHVNHTPYYAGNDSASGIIRYELSGLLQRTLLLDYNQGKDTTNEIVFEAPNERNEVIIADTAGKVAFTEIENATPTSREHYELMGWFDAPKGGNKIEEDLDDVTGITTIYLQWKELVEPNTRVEVGDKVYKGANNVSGSASEKIVADSITIKASDDGAGTGVNNSGMDKLYYYLSKSAVADPSSLADSKWIEAPVKADGENISYTIPTPEDGFYIVYVKAVDKDGNIAYGNTSGFVFEKYVEPTKPAPNNDDEDSPSSPVVKVTPTVQAPEATPAVSPNKPKPTATPTPEEDAQPTNAVEDKSSGAGNVEVTVEHNDSAQNPDDLGVKVNLPDPDSVIDAVLTDDEKKVIEEGGNVVIRLTVDNKTDTPDEELNQFMNDLLDNVKANESLNDNSTVKYEGSLKLTLEKQINGKEWKRISGSGKPIEVVIDIPAELVDSGKRLYIAKPDGNGGYIIFDDLDDDSNTITISTDDFDNEYFIISIDDNEMALADKINDENCHWHWLQLLLFLIAIATAVAYWKKEEEDDLPATDDGNERKIRRKGHWIIVVAANGCSILLIILGSCVYEIPFAIITVVVSSLVEAFKGYKNKK